MKTPKTTPVKNMPTHGPGTYAFYKGSKCKILSIGGGKAKIMVNGQIKLVNYTSLDDEMYGTGVQIPINEVRGKRDNKPLLNEDDKVLIVSIKNTKCLYLSGYLWDANFKNASVFNYKNAYNIVNAPNSALNSADYDIFFVPYKKELWNQYLMGAIERGDDYLISYMKKLMQSENVKINESANQDAYQE